MSSLIGIILIYCFSIKISLLLIFSRERIVLSIFLIFIAINFSTASDSEIYSQNFDMLTSGTFEGQDGWELTDEYQSLAQVIEDTSIAISPPKFLNIAGKSGTQTRIWRLLGTNNFSDLEDCCLSFNFSPENPQYGAKNSLYLKVFGNNGSIEDYILYFAIDFETSKIIISSKGGDSFNASLKLPSLVAGDWYLLRAVLKPSNSTCELTIKDSTDNIIGSGTYSFAGTSETISNIYRIDFFNNINGRLDWRIDNLVITSESLSP